MDHVHLDDAKENNQVIEATDDSLNTSINESLQLFKPKILNAIEIIKDKRKNVPILIQFMIRSRELRLQTQIKTLIENVVRELIRQKILIN